MERNMEIDKMVQKGMSRKEFFQVAREHTAAHVGSGDSRVLATPWMIAYMERVAHRLLAENLPGGESSVGVLVDVRHLAPTPLGATVRVQAEIVMVAGSQVTFSVQAWDQVEKIGEGRHERVVINEARFLRRVEGKQ
jgi:fluoroacetyl-CoA thioesterase